MRISSFGWTAKPVRSGPICVPSPPCLWHLAQCCVNTFLPLADVAGLREDRACTPRSPSARSGLGSPPPWASSFFARSASSLSGWLASAVRWSRASMSKRSVPFSTASRNALRRVGLGEHEPQRRGPRCGRQVLQLADDRGADALRLRLRQRLEDSGRERGRRLRRDRVHEQLARPSSLVGPELDRPAAPRRAGRRRSPSRSATVANAALVISASCASSPFTPHVEASLSSRPRDAAGSLARSGPMAFSTPPSSFVDLARPAIPPRGR